MNSSTIVDLHARRYFIALPRHCGKSNGESQTESAVKTTAMISTASTSRIRSRSVIARLH